MRKRLWHHVCFLVVLAVLVSFAAAGVVMYGRFNEQMEQSVRNEAEYIREGIEEAGRGFLNDTVGNLTITRITLVDGDGVVVFDSEEEAETMENHKNRPEFERARREGSCEMTRYSKTLAKQTYYYALRLGDGSILRASRTEDSLLAALLSSVALLGGVLSVVLALAVYLVNVQVKRLIEPINELNLEEPLKEVDYEELRPLLVRVDEQNRQIKKQMKELENAGKLRREFSANVSHELKTPLMSISGYAEIMKNGMVRQEDMTEFAGRIYHEASRLTTLVEDIIELSKLDENNSEMPFETVDISELTADVMQNLESYAKSKRISMSFNGDKEICIRGVHHLLYEMFFNLTDNAIKYNEEGGWVHVSIRRIPGGAEWSVNDNGIGIAKEDQERIFERFYRVDKSHSRETGGTGLGLSIVKHGAMLHHAGIELESEVGRGTKITLRFSRQEA